MMADQITTVSQLEALYDRPSRNSLVKVAQHITPEYGAWIGASRFCILSTVGADGTDGSPRGDEDPVAWIQDPQTLLMPDWRGNNRLDSSCTLNCAPSEEYPADLLCGACGDSTCRGHATTGEGCDNRP